MPMHKIQADGKDFFVHDDTLMTIGCCMHECHRIYQMSIGGPTMPHWNELPEDVRRNLIGQVLILLNKPEWTPFHVHYNRIAELKKDGWKKGEVHDPAQKTSPLIADYEQVPVPARQLYYIDLAVVSAFRDFALNESVEEVTEYEPEYEEPAPLHPVAEKKIILPHEGHA